MSDGSGVCKDCKWWQVEPDASVDDATMGLCIEEQLQPYNLRVSGNSGCNAFVAGEPARAKGSGDQLPAASPQR